jgi:fatty-acid peroxygenase
MPSIPRTRAPDSSLALLREGYLFIGRRCQRLGSDVFLTHLMLKPTICMLGKDAAEVFYDERRFSRANAAPARLLDTLLGRGGVQGLDGEEHRHRKRMFMDLMGKAQLEELAGRTRYEWERAASEWAKRKEPVELFEEGNRVLCRAVCGWAGVPLGEAEVEHITRDLVALVEGGGGVGPRYLRGRMARWRADRWAGELICRQRKGQLKAAPDRALALIAAHHDLQGELLPPHVAAVELLNVLRPTVAISRFVVFAAMALHQHESARDFLHRLPRYSWAFVQEVRRYYPFFPFAAARVRQTFQWRDYTFPEGTRTLLDLYGTDHDPRHWGDPETFRPERFLGRPERPFDFIPQGGGDPFRHHRCAGEGPTLALMEVALDFLLHRVRYEVPKQDLTLDLARMPALPPSGFQLKVTGMSF